VAGARRAAVDPAEPLAGDAQPGRPWSPAGQSEERRGAGLETSEDADVVGDRVGGADGEDLGVVPSSESEAEGGADGGAAGAEGDDDDIGPRPPGLVEGGGQLQARAHVADRAERRGRTRPQQ